MAIRSFNWELMAAVTPLGGWLAHSFDNRVTVIGSAIIIGWNTRYQRLSHGVCCMHSAQCCHTPIAGHKTRHVPNVMHTNAESVCIRMQSCHSVAIS